MDIDIKKIKEIFKNIVDDFNLTLLSRSNDGPLFNVIYSDFIDFTNQNEISIYDCRPLLRFFLEKTNSLSSDIAQSIFKTHEQQEICYILSWDKKSVDVLIFHLKEGYILNAPEFVNLAKDNLKLIKNLFIEIQNQVRL